LALDGAPQDQPNILIPIGNSFELPTLQETPGTPSDRGP
jgi:hypothetical protein